jgi:hypothetical protein
MRRTASRSLYSAAVLCGLSTLILASLLSMLRASCLARRKSFLSLTLEELSWTLASETCHLHATGACIPAG